MSIVKHLNGHIPIIPANFNQYDSCIQESFSSNKELPSYNELFIDQKRVKHQSRSLLRKLHLNCLKFLHLRSFKL